MRIFFCQLVEVSGICMNFLLLSVRLYIAMWHFR